MYPTEVIRTIDQNVYTFYIFISVLFMIVKKKQDTSYSSNKRWMIEKIYGTPNQ